MQVSLIQYPMPGPCSGADTVYRAVSRTDRPLPECSFQFGETRQACMHSSRKETTLCGVLAIFRETVDKNDFLSCTYLKIFPSYTWRICIIGNETLVKNLNTSYLEPSRPPAAEARTLAAGLHSAILGWLCCMGACVPRNNSLC